MTAVITQSSKKPKSDREKVLERLKEGKSVNSDMALEKWDIKNLGVIISRIKKVHPELSYTETMGVNGKKIKNYYLPFEL